MRSALSPCELYSAKENGDKDRVCESPAEEVEYGQQAILKEAEEKDGDCEICFGKRGGEGGSLFQFCSTGGWTAVVINLRQDAVVK